LKREEAFEKAFSNPMPGKEVQKLRGEGWSEGGGEMVVFRVSRDIPSEGKNSAKKKEA